MRNAAPRACLRACLFACVTPPTAGTVLFGSFDKVAAKSVLQRWRPQVVGKKLVSASNTLDMYVKGNIALNHVNATAVLSDRMDLFILREHADAYSLGNVLWSAGADKESTFKAFKEWTQARRMRVVCQLQGDDAIAWFSVNDKK